MDAKAVTMRRFILAAALLASGALAGCAGSFRGLVREDEVQDLAPLKALTAARPNHTHLIETSRAGEPAARVAVHEIGSGANEWTLILLHGMFTDGSSWRFVQGSLAADHDLWVVDLPGCGDSDAPDPRRHGDAVYDPGVVARRVLTAVRARLNERGSPPRIAIVGHSYGGMIALRMFADSAVAAEFPDVLGRVERLVLISPVDVAIHRADPMFHEIATASQLKLTLGLMFGVVHDKVVEGTRRSVPEDRPALREEAEKRIDILRDPERRRAMQALLLRAFPAAADPMRPDWSVMERLEQGYSRVTPSTLIVWGRRDETLPISMGYKIAAQLPDASMLPLDGCMHSPHMERPALCTRIIADFTRTGRPPDPRVLAGQ